MTGGPDLPAAAERLRLAPDEVKVRLRLVLPPPDRTLPDGEATLLRDRVDLALHRGRAPELISGYGFARRRWPA